MGFLKVVHIYLLHNPVASKIVSTKKMTWNHTNIIISLLLMALPEHYYETTEMQLTPCKKKNHPYSLSRSKLFDHTKEYTSSQAIHALQVLFSVFPHCCR